MSVVHIEDERGRCVRNVSVLSEALDSIVFEINRLVECGPPLGPLVVKIEVIDRHGSPKPILTRVCSEAP